MRRKMIKSVCLIISIFLGLFFTNTKAIADCPDGGSARQEELGKLLLKTKYNGISCGYLGQPYSWMDNQAHPGIDYRGTSGTVVYAPVSGEYNLSSTEVLGKASYVILPNGKRLFLLHMKELILGKREKGQEIGKIYDDHVHAELRVSYSGTYLVGGVSCGGTCTLDDIEEKTDDPSEVVTKTFNYKGNISWWPADKSCEEASERYDLTKPPYLQPSSVCSQLYEKIQTISQNTNPSLEVPEEHYWQSWWRSLIKIFGPKPSTDKIMNYTVTQEISIPDDNSSSPVTVISGSGSSPTDGTGFGYGINPTETPVYALPDFITTEVRLKTPDGIEKYEYDITDEIKMHAWFQNIGDADWAGTHDDMKVRFYLSKGYKEDSHSEWIRVGSDTIQKYNIELGDPPKHEEEGLMLSNYSEIQPGKVYNIVACADRIADKDNADGDVPEKHKSNNCSTEAVFWVKAKPEGYLNQATCDMIQGWARDPDTANPISVHFYADGPAGTGTYIGSADADTYREDLPYSDKNHGFSFKTPDSLKNNQVRSIYVYAIDSQGGQNPLLNNSPQNIQCQLVPVEAIMAIINTILLSDDPLIPGDLNGDTFVTLADAILALKVISYSGNQSVQIESDVNNDKKIGLVDAVYILQKVSKIR